MNWQRLKGKLLFLSWEARRPNRTITVYPTEHGKVENKQGESEGLRKKLTVKHSQSKACKTISRERDGSGTTADNITTTTTTLRPMGL